MGIYCYELYKLYNVENIIRIGSCGGYKPELKLFDIILSENVFCEGNFALTLNNDNCHIATSDTSLNEIIENTANENNLKLIKGNTCCTDCFDLYMTDVNQFLTRIPEGFNPVGVDECFDGYLEDIPAFIHRFPKDLNIIACEMEAFALFYVAKLLNKKASCLMSVVDSKYIKDVATAEERETGLNNMITLALDASLKI